MFLVDSCNDLTDIIGEGIDENFIVIFVEFHQCKEVDLAHSPILVVVKQVENHALQQIHLGVKQGLQKVNPGTVIKRIVHEVSESMHDLLSDLALVTLAKMGFKLTFS